MGPEVLSTPDPAITADVTRHLVQAGRHPMWQCRQSHGRAENSIKFLPLPPGNEFFAPYVAVANHLCIGEESQAKVGSL